MAVRNTRRADRVGEAIREEIATFLAESAKDPRIVGFVTVTGVEVSPDLRHARVFVSVMGSEAEKAATFEGLDSTASHLRARAARIESLLADIKSGSANPGSASDSASSAGKDEDDNG